MINRKGGSSVALALAKRKRKTTVVLGLARVYVLGLAGMGVLRRTVLGNGQLLGRHD